MAEDSLTLKQQQTHREVLGCAPYFIGSNMNEKQKEIMLIAQEECAEVVQAISKCFRFGFNEKHPSEIFTNQQRLEEEVGDLLCMIDLMVEKNIINGVAIDTASLKKKEKLKTWSNIFDEEVTFN
jgi:NTP pyrophosphatase (non-canonical NTP hydrolase)